MLFLFNYVPQRNDLPFRREIATKLFHNGTIYNFHLNNWEGLLKTLSKIRFLLLKMLNQSENKN